MTNLNFQTDFHAGHIAVGSKHQQGIVTTFTGVLILVLLRVQWPAIGGEPSATLISDLGQAMVGNYALPFEAVSVLLLVALVGSIIIARER